MATNKPTEDTTRTTEGEEKIEIDTILSFIGISKNTPLITHLSKLYNYTLKGVSNSRIRFLQNWCLLKVKRASLIKDYGKGKCGLIFRLKMG